MSVAGECEPCLDRRCELAASRSAAQWLASSGARGGRPTWRKSSLGVHSPLHQPAVRLVERGRTVLPFGCRAPFGRLPTRQVVTADRPHPARQVVPYPRGLRAVRSRGRALHVPRVALRSGRRRPTPVSRWGRRPLTGSPTVLPKLVVRRLASALPYPADPVPGRGGPERRETSATRRGRNSRSARHLARARSARFRRPWRGSRTRSPRCCRPPSGCCRSGRSSPGGRTSGS